MDVECHCVGVGGYWVGLLCSLSTLRSMDDGA